MLPQYAWASARAAKYAMNFFVAYFFGPQLCTHDKQHINNYSCLKMCIYEMGLRLGAVGVSTLFSDHEAGAV